MPRRKTAPPRGVLKTAVADPDRYRHARFHPSPDLAAFVEHYWSVQWDLRGLAPERVETLPHPSVHMIFERPVGARITGVARGKFSALLEGQGSVFAVKFRPGGFYPFVGVSVSTFSETSRPPREVFGAEAVRLEETLLADGTDEDRITVVEDFLRRRTPKPEQQAFWIGEMVYAAAADRSIVKVEDLVTRYNTSTRTLQRLFAKYVGIGPKWVIQRYRLHEAAEQLGAGGSVRQSALAVSLGYSDQAHFVRDFRAIVGTSPAAYAREVKRLRR